MTVSNEALEAAARALALQASVSEMEAHGYNGIHAREYADEWWRSHLDRARAAVSAYLAALNETHALVPREASDSMTEAAQDAADDHFSIDADKGPWLRQDGYKAAWAAMIKAALTAQEPRS